MNTIPTPDYHYCTPETAARFADWLATRGGIAVWRSADLSNPSQSWSTPALTPDGAPTPKLSWKMQSAPERIITDINLIRVSVWREVKRMHVAVRLSSQGLAYRLTDASSKRLRETVARISRETGREVTYAFDYGTQEAVISVEEEAIPLQTWLDAHKGGNCP